MEPSSHCQMLLQSLPVPLITAGHPPGNSVGAMPIIAAERTDPITLLRMGCSDLAIVIWEASLRRRITGQKKPIVQVGELICDPAQLWIKPARKSAYNNLFSPPHNLFDQRNEIAISRINDNPIYIVGVSMPQRINGQSDVHPF